MDYHDIDHSLFAESSDSESEEGGHPKERKEDVLTNLFNGFKYHKDGPAQPYQWTEQEILKMSQHLEQYASSVKVGRRKKILTIKF